MANKGFDTVTADPSQINGINVHVHLLKEVVEFLDHPYTGQVMEGVVNFITEKILVRVNLLLHFPPLTGRS